jgi:DNA-binding MarR family transcriptional regulator
MEKIYLDNFYNNINEDNRIMALGVPLALIYKYLFNENNQSLQEKYDLTLSEGDVLFSLYFNGKVLSPTNLYKATVLTSGGMTKILKKLQDKKLISRIPAKEDKRSMLVKMDSKGEQLIETSLKDIIEVDNKIFSVLNNEEKRILETIFKKLVYSLNK